MPNELVVIAKCIKTRNRRLIILSLYLFLIVFIVMTVYYYMTVERPQFKDSSYIPLCFLVLAVPFIYFIIRIAFQQKNVMFYDAIENKIYYKDSKLGILKKGYDVYDIAKIETIYIVPRPKKTPSLFEILRMDIKEIDGLHFIMKDGWEFVINNFDDYASVIMELEKLLPLKYKHIIN